MYGGGAAAAMFSQLFDCLFLYHSDKVISPSDTGGSPCVDLLLFFCVCVVECVFMYDGSDKPNKTLGESPTQKIEAAGRST